MQVRNVTPLQKRQVQPKVLYGSIGHSNAALQSVPVGIFFAAAKVHYPVSEL